MFEERFVNFPIIMKEAGVGVGAPRDLLWNILCKLTLMACAVAVKGSLVLGFEDSRVLAY